MAAGSAGVSVYNYTVKRGLAAGSAGVSVYNYIDVYKTYPAVHVATAPVELGDGHERGGVEEDVARGDGGRVVDVPGNP